jgi:hypothetical protein
MVVLQGGTGGTTLNDCRSAWQPRTGPTQRYHLFRTKILWSTTGTTGPTEKLKSNELSRNSECHVTGRDPFRHPW